jgi:hypothetical protein
MLLQEKNNPNPLQTSSNKNDRIFVQNLHSTKKMNQTASQE